MWQCLLTKGLQGLLREAIERWGVKVGEVASKGVEVVCNDRSLVVLGLAAL